MATPSGRGEDGSQAGAGSGESPSTTTGSTRSPALIQSPLVNTNWRIPLSNGGLQARRPFDGSPSAEEDVDQQIRARATPAKKSEHSNHRKGSAATATMRPHVACRSRDRKRASIDGSIPILSPIVKPEALEDVFSNA